MCPVGSVSLPNLSQEYLNLMVFKDGKPSAFYQEYIKNIQVKIVENAALEFACIWNEYSRPGSTKTRTAISDELSGKLNTMQAQLESSDLFDDGGSRRVVLKKAIPQALVKQVGLDALMKRLPEPYQKALVSSWIAAHFVRVFFAIFRLSLMLLIDLSIRHCREQR
jgi:glutamate dehydrogenase